MQELGAALKDSCAPKSGMECILCVSQIQSSYLQDFDSSPTLLVHQITQPLIATEVWFLLKTLIIFFSL